jgi:uncharacterized protein YndB with AHSA1/START domain
MGLQPEPAIVRWHIHLNTPPALVFEALSTDSGRARWWAESARERDGHIHFRFPNGALWSGRIVASDPPRRFAVEYLGRSQAAFDLAEDGRGGTDLTLTDSGVSPEDRAEVLAGWVSVLLALKAALDFQADLRNHDPRRTWDQGFADN